LMLIYSRVSPPFFRGQTLVRGRSDLLLPGTARMATMGLPDSAEPGMVVAPDLSNLPPTMERSRVVDPDDPDERER
jgi:hypothetical protein